MALSITNPDADRQPGIATRLRRLADEVKQVPVLDARDPDEILGYDEDGLAT